MSGYHYPKCYIAEGCEGDEACVVFCPTDRAETPQPDPANGDQP